MFGADMALVAALSYVPKKAMTLANFLCQNLQENHIILCIMSISTGGYLEIIFTLCRGLGQFKT